MSALRLGFLTILCSGLISCSSFFKRNPNSADKPRHYVMTLHGVRGNAVSFGDFHSLIKHHLEQIDPGYEVIPVNMTYTVGEPDFSAHKAAVEINQKLDQQLKSFSAQDKISVVAYSMGGQVGMIWLFDSLKDPAHRKYAEQTAKFVSLGAPFYGSKEASLGTSIDNLFGQLDADVVSKNLTERYSLLGKVITSDKISENINAVVARIKSDVSNFPRDWDNVYRKAAKISFNELKSLSLGSDVTNEIRMGFINNKNLKTKFASISSLVNCFETDLTSEQPGCQSFQNKYFKSINADIFGKFTFGYTRRETDNSVITPSANANFIYAVEADSSYDEGHTTSISQFRYATQNQEFYLTEGLHATVIPASGWERFTSLFSKAGKSWEGLADDVVLVYEKDCKNPENCKHPAYRYMVRELADCSRENSTCNATVEKKVVSSLFPNHDETDGPRQMALRSELHGFTIEFNMRVPKGYNLEQITHQNLFKFFKVNFENPKEHIVKSSPDWPYKIILARPNELASLAIKRVTQYANQDQLRVVMTGLIVPRGEEKYDHIALEKGAYLKIDTALPGLKSRKIEALVRPYHSTFVDLVFSKPGAE